MVGVAVGVAAAGSVASGVIQGNAARDAANAGVQASRNAANAQRQMFERQVQLQEPFRQGGLTALRRYLTYFGLEAPTVYAGGTMTPPSTTGPNGRLLTGRALRTSQENQNLPPELFIDPNDPNFGRFSRDFGMADFEADPGYAFRMKEGLKALEGRAASRGGLLSGNTLRGITEYGQESASQEYTNAFNRYQINRKNQLAPLEGLLGMGKSSADTLTGAAGNLGTGLADAAYNQGNARASGYIGQGNAMSGAIGGLTNALGSFNYGGGLFGSGGQQYFQGTK
jgi:hypothetical protein